MQKGLNQIIRSSLFVSPTGNDRLINLIESEYRTLLPDRASALQLDLIYKLYRAFGWITKIASHKIK